MPIIIAKLKIITNPMSAIDRNYTEKQLKTAIQKERIQRVSYYYSVAKKEQKSFSLMSNERLLVFNFEEGCLFYSNQIRGLPLKYTAPPAKNNIKISILNTTVINAPNSNTIQFSFLSANENQTWKFQFETLQLTQQWLKLFDMYRQTQIVQDRDMKAVNKSIVELSKIEQQNTKDIVKEEQRDILFDQSRILNQMMGVSKSRISEQSPPPPIVESQVKKQYSNVKKGPTDDWNFKFYQERNIKTLYEYQNFAADAFFEALNKDDYLKGGVRYYETKNCTIKIANKFTPEAKKLKNEYRNYHCILEATNKQWIIGVPLACLIDFECVVGLVKARFPDQLRPIAYDSITKDHFNQLERYTRVKNKVLENALLFNLAEHYDPSLHSLLYVEDLFIYLPPNLQFPTEQTLIRPEYMLDHINYYIYNNIPQKLSKTDIRTLKELSYSTLDKIKQFNIVFSRQSFPIIRISELKELIHESGLNFKSLPLVYNQCQNPYIRRYIYTGMTAKIVKDYVFQSMVQIKRTKSNSLQAVLEETLSWLLSGNNNKSHEFWKEIALMFKKKYNLILIHKDLIPGFFLNSILELIPGSYDITKLQKNKVIFQHTKIIEPGFVKMLQPKIKCYNRFLPFRLEQLKNEARFNKHSRQMCEQIRRQFFGQANKEGSNTYFQFGNNDEWIIQYLSLYYPPENMADENEDRINGLFTRINEQPPSNFTITLTKNYLQWCNKKEQTEEFKRVFKIAMEIADYWLDEYHPVRSDLLEILSDYYALLGMHEDMIKFMKDSLLICSKFWGPTAEHTGIKQYELADRYLKANRKKDALQYFLKAKENIHQNKTKTNKLGLTHLKLASIYLSDLEYQKAASYARDSINIFEDYQRKIKSYGLYNQPYKIKAYELLSRVFEICDQRTEYKDLALTCARKFNQTKNEDVFEQMIRICLASVIFKSTAERAESFQLLIESQYQTLYEQDGRRLPPIGQLRRMGQQMIVMEKFMTKYEFIDRNFFDSNNRKKQYLLEDNKDFVHILRNIIQIVGIDYLKGLIEEKVSCG